MTDLVEGTLEAPLSLCTIIPFFVDNPEGKVFVRWSSHKPNETCVFLSRLGRRFTALPTVLTFDAICWGLGLVDQVGIEDVELVTLYNLGWRVVMVVMGLVVFVPFVTHLDTVEVSRFPGSMLSSPLGLRSRTDRLFASEYLLILADTLGELPFIECFGRL